jgi:hypothetical protein
MLLKRTAVLALLFACLVWLAIGILEPIGAMGLAGPVVQANLENQTDATALFYTDIDRDAYQLERAK